MESFKSNKHKKQLIYSIEGMEKQLVSFLSEKYKKKIQAKRDGKAEERAQEETEGCVFFEERLEKKRHKLSPKRNKLKKRIGWIKEHK